MCDIRIDSLTELYHRVLQLDETEARRLAALPLPDRITDLVRRGGELRTPPIGMCLTMPIREQREREIIAAEYRRLACRWYDLAVVAEDVEWRATENELEAERAHYIARHFRMNHRRCEQVVTAAQERRLVPA